MVGADHPQGASVLEHPPAGTQPGTGEVIVFGKTAKLVPGIVDPRDPVQAEAVAQALNADRCTTTIRPTCDQRPFHENFKFHVERLLFEHAPLGYQSLDADGRFLATTCSDGSARVWEARTGHLVADPFVHKAEVRRAEFSPDGRRLLTGSFDGTAAIWDLNSLRPPVPVPDWVRRVATLETRVPVEVEGGPAVTLAGDALAGSGVKLRLTSVLDLAVQELDAELLVSREELRDERRGDLPRGARLPSAHPGRGDT